MIINVAADPGVGLATAVGTQADTAATTDTIAASIIAYLKRITSKQPTLVGGYLPVVMGQGSSAGTVTQSSYSVATTAGTALAANPNRKRALLINLPTNTVPIYLSFVSGVTVANGIPLQPGQGWLEAFDLTHTGLFSAISASGTPALTLFEWV